MNLKKQAFIDHYMLSGNATQAAKAARYSERTAHSIGARLLKNVEVAREIEKRRSAQQKRLETSGDDVVKVLVEKMQADLGDIHDDDGALKPIKEWPAIWRRGLVAGMKVKELFDVPGKDGVVIGHLVEVKLMDRSKILDMLMKHFNMYAKDDEDKLKTATAQLVEWLTDKTQGTNIRPAAERSAPGPQRLHS